MLVDEKHVQACFAGVAWGCQDCAVHVGVTSRFQQEPAPEVIIELHEVATLLKHCRAMDRWETGDNDAERFDAGMGMYRWWLGGGGCQFHCGLKRL